MSARLRAVGPDLRRVNQSALLRLLFLEGPLDRVRLGQMTGLSSGTVTNFVASLLEDGLIIEVGREQSEGGRPRVLLGVNPEYGAVVGVDIGETGIRVEAFDLDLRVIGVSDVALHPQHVDASVTVAETARAIERLREQLQAEGRRLLGVGIGVPGMVEHGSNGARVHAPLIGWQDVPLERQ